MIKIINLDLNSKLKPTDMAFRIGVDYEVYYRISHNEYDIDYDKFENLRLTIRVNKTSVVDYVVLDSTNVVEVNDIKYLSWKVPNVYLKEESLLLVEYVSKYDNKNYNIRSSNYQVYNKPSPEMNGILQAIDKYNSAINLYLESIKRKEIDVPNGLIGLDSEGRIKEDMFKSELKDHIPTRLIDTLDKVESIHGLRLHGDKKLLQYYDIDDLEYYHANQIHGGQLGFNNKPEQYNIFGGNLGSYSGMIDALEFNIEVNDTIDASNLSETNDSFVDGGSFRMTEEENEDIYLNRIHGGFL